jgi:hypothetical protein
MLDLLRLVAENLAARRIPHALIGAGALAVHGVLRVSDDLDLLVTDRSVLLPATWGGVVAAGATVEPRAGDDDDPLAGVVRVSRAGVIPVDVVVGKFAWQRDLVARAQPRNVGAVLLPVVTPADFVLLKLHAGSAKDLHDIASLLEGAAEKPAIVAAVSGEVGRLPADARSAWERMLELAGPGLDF